MESNVAGISPKKFIHFVMANVIHKFTGFSHFINLISLENIIEDIFFCKMRLNDRRVTFLLYYGRSLLNGHLNCV